MGIRPGHLVLLGSGETSASGRRVFDWLLQQYQPPIRLAILETPAGFQPNSEIVARKVAEFLQHHLANYALEIVVVPARRRGTTYSPDDPELADAVLSADCVFLGPGSPTYAARQLRESVVWDALRARFATGAPVVLASAAVLSIGAYTLPVYEIYKAGADLGWERGLDLLGPTGRTIVFIPHWNNREGGADLDTSHCFVGEGRFDQLRSLLPEAATIVGIDEHTALILDPGAGTALVLGSGQVTIPRTGGEDVYRTGSSFSLDELGTLDWAAFVRDVPPALLDRATRIRHQAENSAPVDRDVPGEVLDLVSRREAARRQRDWHVADDLRDEVARRGYRVEDTPAGPRVRPASG